MTDTDQDFITQRIFWVIVPFIFSSLAAIGVFALSHSVTPFHPGMPLYVQEHVKTEVEAVENKLESKTDTLMVEIRGLRKDIQLLRETLIRMGESLPNPHKE